MAGVGVGVVTLVAAAVVVAAAAGLFAGSVAACSGPAAEAVSFWSGCDLAVPAVAALRAVAPGDAE